MFNYQCIWFFVKSTAYTYRLWPSWILLDWLQWMYKSTFHLGVSKQNFYSAYNGKAGLMIMINSWDLYLNAFTSQERRGILQVLTSLQWAREKEVCTKNLHWIWLVLNPRSPAWKTKTITSWHLSQELKYVTYSLLHILIITGITTSVKITESVFQS
jgi:hypothetical protein